MIVWTTANQKGGVGKTTTCVSLAGWLAKEGKRVLLLDTDPHASLTNYFDYDSDELPHTLFDVFLNPNLSTQELLQIILPTKYENISIMPGSIALATLDRTLGEQDGVGLILKNALERLQDYYDIVLIDCPPVLGVMMVNALASSTQILVPTQTEFLALKGLERMMKTFEILHTTVDKPFKYIIIPTMYDKRTKASILSLQSIREHYKDQVWKNYIPIDTKFRDSSHKHVPPAYLIPDSRGTHAYYILLQDLLKEEGKLSEK